MNILWLKVQNNVKLWNLYLSLCFSRVLRKEAEKQGKTENWDKVGNADCPNSVATLLRVSGKIHVATIRLLLKHKLRRIPERQVKNVVTFKSYVATKSKKNVQENS